MAKPFNREKDKTNWFRTVSQDPDQIEQLKINCKSFPRWFWIIHQPDNENGVEHMHLLVLCSGSYLIKTVARKLEVPENMVQPAFNHQKDARYFLHLDSPEKLQYTIDDIHTNSLGMYKSMITDSFNDDIHSLFHDLTKVRAGSLSVEGFIELHFKELQTMPFYQKIKTFEYLDKITTWHESAT